jgi:hypothetical protein
MITALNIPLLSEAALCIIATLAHAMAQVSFFPFELSRSRHSESLCPTLVGFHFVTSHITSSLMGRES